MSSIAYKQAQGEGEYRITLTTPDHVTERWGPAWLTDPPAETLPPTLIAAAISPELEHLSGDEPFAEVDAEAENEWYWVNIDAADVRYFTAPRNHPEPCPRCGGRTRHAPMCYVLRLEWEPELPFGKHKGKRLSEVPRDYLAWLIGHASLDADLRNAIEALLKPPPR